MAGPGFALVRRNALSTPIKAHRVAGFTTVPMPSHRPVFEERPVAASRPDLSESLRDHLPEPLEQWEDFGGFAHAPEARLSEAYNEEAFRYFLELERKRSEVSSRPFLLLLIDLKKQAGWDSEPSINYAIADKLFSALSTCLRETDFVGWYREGRVAGAVLTQHTETAAGGVPDLVSPRVVVALQHALSEAVASRLQVRVYQLPANGRQIKS
jgi:hypothetical protein